MPDTAPLTRPRARSGVFGEVAETYDRVRPSYPPEAIDALVARGGDGDVLELGAGTGKLTRLLAPHAKRIVALEADCAMAAIARSHLSGISDVDVVVTRFEDHPTPPGRYDLVCAAQSWHWMEVSTRAEQAARALVPGGWLALMWNRPRIVDRDLNEELLAAYDRHAPEVKGRGCGVPSVDGQPDIADELAAVAVFGEPETVDVDWTVRMSTRQHADLLDTMSELRLLAPDRRAALIGDISAVIDGHGGAIDQRYTCRIITARRDG